MIIYKSFYRKKSTKIYFFIFTIISLILLLLNNTREQFISKENEAYNNSFLYFESNKNIEFNDINNILSYNKTIPIYCDDITNIFITNSIPIINSDNNKEKVCNINEFTINYYVGSEYEIIPNEELYNSLTKENENYYYFIKLDNWHDYKKTVKELENKYNISINIVEENNDDNDYRKPIFIFNILIIILIMLFILILILTIINIIIDEKNNNKLYKSLGFNKVYITIITINKIIMLLILPLLIVLSYLVLR